MDREARIIYGLCIAITTPFIVSGIARYHTIGAGTTICMLIAALGILGFINEWRRRPRLPVARALTPERGAPARRDPHAPSPPPHPVQADRDQS